MKIPKPAYTAEFKELAVKRVKDGQSVSVVCKELGLGEQTVRNWIKAAAEGKLNGAGGRVVTPEGVELSRRRVENLRLKRENEILKKSDGVLRERCSVKYAPQEITWGGAWFAEKGKRFALAEMCGVFDASISGYRAWTRGGRSDRRRLTDSRMLALIRAIRAELKGVPRQPKHGARAACLVFLCQQGTGRTADARQRHSCPPQAALQNDDGLEAHSACSRELAGQKLYADGAELGLDLGHYLRLDGRGLVVSGDRARPVQQGNRRLGWGRA